MNLPSVKNLKVAGKKVLLRTNYDVPITAENCVGDDSRIQESLATINYLRKQGAKIILLSHLGRPGGRRAAHFSLKPVAVHLNHLLGGKVPLVARIDELAKRSAPLLLLENLRFWPGETTNKPVFARRLASLAQVYVNDAFAVSHRQHASVVGLPSLLPSAFGLDFLEEVTTLAKLRQKPKRPVVVILGGRKKSKLAIGAKLTAWADYVLIGGMMATYEKELATVRQKEKNLMVATREGEDISLSAINQFVKVIKKAQTVVWSGPLGQFEKKEYQRGTKMIGEAVAASQAYTVIGGGGTEAAMTKFGLEKEVDYVSSGGGAMLAFLVEETLPGIEAIKKNTHD